MTDKQLIDFKEPELLTKHERLRRLVLINEQKIRKIEPVIIKRKDQSNGN